MAVIVNDPRNLPKTIQVIELEAIEKLGVSEDFIKELVIPKNNKIGKEDEKHYMIQTNGVIKFKSREFMNISHILADMMERCQMLNIQYLMILKRKQ